LATNTSDARQERPKKRRCPIIPGDEGLPAISRFGQRAFETQQLVDPAAAEADEVIASKAAIRTVQTNPDYTSVVARSGAWHAPDGLRNIVRLKVHQHANANRRRPCIHAVGEFVR
jgi:hypothetical protein